MQIWTSLDSSCEVLSDRARRAQCRERLRGSHCREPTVAWPSRSQWRVFSPLTSEDVEEGRPPTTAPEPPYDPHPLLVKHQHREVALRILAEGQGDRQGGTNTMWTTQEELASDRLHPVLESHQARAATERCSASPVISHLNP